MSKIIQHQLNKILPASIKMFCVFLLLLGSQFDHSSNTIYRKTWNLDDKFQRQKILFRHMDPVKQDRWMLDAQKRIKERSDLLTKRLKSIVDLSKISREKNDFLEEKSYHDSYEIVIVGAGVHSAIAQATIANNFPNLIEKTLVITQDNCVGGNYEKTGSMYFLNSPDFTFQKNNYIDSSPFQILDFASSGYNIGSDLAKPIIATLNFHPHILLNQKVKRINEIKNSSYGYILETSQGLKVKTKKVILAVGLATDLPKFGLIDEESKRWISSLSKTESPQVEHYIHFVKRVTKHLKNSRNHDLMATYYGKDIAIIGGGGAAGTTVEALDGLGPADLYGGSHLAMGKRLAPAIGSMKGVQSVNMYSNRFNNILEYNSFFRDRYLKTLVENKTKIQFLNYRPVKLSYSPKKRKIILKSKHDIKLYDYVFFATAYANPTLPAYRYCTDIDRCSVNQQPLLASIKKNKDSSKFIASTYKIQKQDSTWTDLNSIIVIGPAAGDIISFKEFSKAVGSSTTSLELFSKRSKQATIQLIEKDS